MEMPLLEDTYSFGTASHLQMLLIFSLEIISGPHVGLQVSPISSALSCSGSGSLFSDIAFFNELAFTVRSRKRSKHSRHDVKCSSEGSTDSKQLSLTIIILKLHTVKLTTEDVYDIVILVYCHQ